ncbi:MAG: sel1 repeat family protein [Rhodomicrobium sp.]|nr:sel1 repeat family protein [Rhodomicrobium sp.]
MPEFGFPLSTRKGDEDRNLSSAQADEDGASAAKAILDSPPSDDTGWRHTESIERASAFESGEETGETVDEPAAFLPFRRQEANVMPFPSSAIQRPADQTPSEMLGGTAEFDEEAFPNGSGEDAQRSASDYGDDAHDALADAVQSALKNVYGGQSRDEAAPDLDSYTVADTLRLSAQERQQPEDESWREQSQDWPEENQDNYYETKSEPSEAETSTDAVLDYLYGHRRGERREATVLSADSSLRDFGEASGYGSRDWQDGSDYDDEAGAPGDLRDFGGPAFRNNPPPYAEPAEHSFPRERAYRGQPAEEPAWAEQRFPGVSAAAAPGSTYPIHLPSGNQESLAAGSPDSTHLLGAAGLGLIGGIALAGVLAVFVFNSFVDEGDPNAAAVAPKVVERLGGEPAETPSPTRPAPIQQAAIAREEPAPSPVQPAQPRFDAQPAFTQPARPSAPPAPAEDQKLIAYDVTGEASSPIQLALQLGETVDENGVLVSIKGLPSKARLSTGIDVGGGQWLLPPSRMSDLMVSIPDSAGGIHTLEAQLLKDDAQTVLSDPVSFKLGVGQEAAETLARQRQTASPNPNADQAERYAVLPDETPQIDTDLLTQMLIRDGNKLMRDGDIAGARRLYEQAAANGNPEAALAMGRSFDPSYFEKLPVKTGKPDPAVAFEWYKKALEGGLVTARVKIDGLKQWLQR